MKFFLLFFFIADSSAVVYCDDWLAVDWYM